MKKIIDPRFVQSPRVDLLLALCAKDAWDTSSGLWENYHMWRVWSAGISGKPFTHLGRIRRGCSSSSPPAQTGHPSAGSSSSTWWLSRTAPTRTGTNTAIKQALWADLSWSEARRLRRRCPVTSCVNASLQAADVTHLLQHAAAAGVLIQGEAEGATAEGHHSRQRIRYAVKCDELNFYQNEKNKKEGSCTTTKTVLLYLKKKKKPNAAVKPSASPTQNTKLHFRKESNTPSTTLFFILLVLRFFTCTIFDFLSCESALICDSTRNVLFIDLVFQCVLCGFFFDWNFFSGLSVTVLLELVAVVLWGRQRDPLCGTAAFRSKLS